MADFAAGFVSLAMGMASRRLVVAAVSFGVRSSPAADPSVVVAFSLCRCPTRFVTAGFVLAADPSDPADSVVVVAVAAAAAAAVAAAAVAAAVAVVAAGPDSVGSAFFA